MHNRNTPPPLGPDDESTPQPWPPKAPDKTDSIDSLDQDPRAESPTVDSLSTNALIKIDHALNPSPSPRPNPEKIGDYTIVRRLGDGGFGIVYEARHNLTGKRVALKLPLRALPRESGEWRRFINEARAGLGLNHPNLVPVLQIFEPDTGLCIVSQYVEGPTLSRWLADRRGTVPPRAAASLTRLLAQGVNYLHQRNILHRDLKPSNIMLDTEGSAQDAIEQIGEKLTPRITDFGLARIDDARNLDSISGNPLGTPPYMAPEQFVGKRAQINNTTDVYGVGAILYECLVGVPPFQGDTRAAIMNRVLNEPPVSPRLLRANLPRDLVTICLKCLEKDSSRRYPSAQALADDLKRYLDDEPILARPVSRFERAWRWARRRPSEAALATFAAAAIATIIVGSLVFVESLRLSNAELQKSLFKEKRHSVASAVSLSHEHMSTDRPALALEELRQVGQHLGPDVDPGFAWRLMNHRANRRLSLIWTDRPKINDVIAIQGEPGSTTTHLVAVSDTPPEVKSTSAMVQLWDGSTNQLIRQRPIPPLDSGHPGQSRGPILLYSQVRRDQLSETFRVLDSTSLADLGVIDEISSSPDKKPRAVMLCQDQLAIGFLDEHSVEIWNYRESRRIGTIALDGPLLTLKSSIDGNELFALTADDSAMSLLQLLPGDVDGKARLLHRVEARSRARLKNFGGGSELGISHDGHWLAMNDPANQQVHLWNKTTGEHVLSISLDEDKIGHPVFSPDNHHLAIAHGTGKVAVFDVATGKPVARLAMPVYFVNGLAFDIDSATLNLCSSDDSRIWRWHFLEGPPRSLRHTLSTELNCAAYLPDSQTIVAGGEDGCLHLLNPDGSVRSIVVEPDGSGITDVILLSGGTQAVTSSWSDNGDLRLVDLVNGTTIETMSGHKGPVRDLALHPGGRTLASAGADRTIRQWNLQTASEFRALDRHTDKARTVAFSPDGDELLSAANESRLVHWKSANGQWLDEEQRSQPVQAIVYSPDGDWLATGEETGTIQITNRTTGERREMHAHGSSRGVMALAFHPNSLELASSGGDGTVILWDVTTAQKILQFPVHEKEARDLAFSPDGTRLVSVGQDGSIHEWIAPRD